VLDVKEVQPPVPVVDHSKRYPDIEQLPVAAADVTADQVILIEAGLMSVVATLGRVIAVGVVGVRIVRVGDHPPVPASFSA